jgi:hypothetical protein
MRRAFPIQIARPMHTRGRVEDNIGHRYRLGLFIARLFAGKLFLSTRKCLRRLQMHRHFNLCSLWEHIERRDRFDRESLPQIGQVARKGRRIA